MEYSKEYIHELLFEKIAGTINDQDNVIAEQAILHDPEIRAFWEALVKKMKLPKGQEFLSGLDTKIAWNEITEKINPSHTQTRRLWLLGIAAVFILAVPMAWFFIRVNQDIVQMSKPETKQVYLKTSTGNRINVSAAGQVSIGATKILTGKDGLSYTAPQSEINQWATLVVPNTKEYKIKLSDSTTVWLNAQSTLRFPLVFSEGKREVYLEGEAYFDVQKSTTKEFIVHTSYANVHVHGTTFNVNAYNEKYFAVALVEGAVSAKKGDQLLKLSPGREAVIAENRLQTQSFESSEVLSWMEGAYYFHRKPLSEIAPILTRWFDVKVVFENKKIEKEILTGSIHKEQSLQTVLANLQLTSELTSELKNGILILK